MDTTNDIRRMILKHCSSGEIREVARRNGMRALADDGWRLVRAGATTPEEVLRVTKAQSLGDGTAETAAELIATAEPQAA
jgi:type II secretory ATPase GspE/PulE/Tfp pilus assembly ATPase PilB-like protein